ncbi:tripartite tricarboxylate transporter TctB family protein [Paracoccus binzhouensis]|uniref:tripartite tricarboxylate transporter TctB family protein n=1 Tax=Paracoccus binzhouensis TaxID=2796149 RepID=UPI0018EEDE76|nr:tripartite tricarboxylate transporter TctB family protein [Paracoccus binzhouensis]
MQGTRTKDFWAGVVYAGFGLATMVLARDLPMGSAARMGAGYFPTMLGGLLAAIGLAAMLRGLRNPGEAVPRIHIRPAVLVIGATFFFAATLGYLGLAVALPTAILIAAAASRSFRLAPAPLLGLLGFTAFCVLVFLRGLGVPMPMIGTWFGG